MPLVLWSGDSLCLPRSPVPVLAGSGMYVPRITGAVAILLFT